MAKVAETNDLDVFRDIDRRQLPVLDVGPALSGNKKAIHKLAARWREVWESIGFMCIVNHGISNELIKSMEKEAKRFHDLPIDEKMNVYITTDQKGYSPGYSSLTTHSEFHERKKLDNVEAYVIATDYADDTPTVIAGEPFYGNMPWLPESWRSFSFWRNLMKNWLRRTLNFQKL